MKIVHFIFADVLSGLENISAHILKELASDNQVFYAAPPGKGIISVQKMGVSTIECKTTDKNDILRVYNQIKPDVVHAHDPRVSFVCATAGIPFISHLHSNCSWLKTICPYSIGLLYVCLKADKVICVSKSIIDEFIFSFAMKKKAVVLDNYVDRDEVIEKAAEPFEQKYDICYVGRMSSEKRPLLFIDLVKHICGKLPDTHAVMVGDGEMKSEVKKYISDNRLDSNIDCLGYLDNPYKVVSSSKIGVLTSRNEGFGLVAVEAMILGKPFLAFPVGGLPGIINSENGCLCDSVEIMADEAYKLLTDEKLYETKSKAAAESSIRFTDKIGYIEEIRKIYNEFCQKHQHK